MTMAKIDNRTYYIGFSTVGNEEPPFSLTNIPLVKQDLLNEFNTRRGERVMLPEFGTRIYDLLFDPFDEITRRNIIGDAREVIAREPRVQLVEIDTIDSEQTMRLVIDLIYKPQDVAEQLFIDFERSNEDQL